jgi:protocatechuate 3,4-dioxygenase beta subunit
MDRPGSIPRVSKTMLAPGWLAGRAVDHDGRPLRGARVTTWTCSREGREAVRANGDDAGRFRLGPLAAGVHQMIWCEAPGFARLRLGDDEAPEIAVFPDTTNDLGDIVLAEETVATGKVLDPDGLPVAGAAVALTQYHNQLAHTMGCNGEPQQTRTAADGTFRFGCLATCSAYVEVAVPGHPPLLGGARIASTDRHVELRVLQLDRARTQIAGTVTDRSGAPIAGARVSAFADDEVYATTDRNGVFQFVARTPRVAYVTVSHPECATRTHFHVKDPAQVRVTFDLSRVLEGSVRDATTGESVTIADLNVCEVRRRESDGTITLAG